MNEPVRYSPELRERTVRMVVDKQGAYPSQWVAMQSIAGKIGFTADSLRKWVRQSQAASSEDGGIADLDRLKALELENRELKRANEILRKDSAFFAKAKCEWQAPRADQSDGGFHR